VIDPDNSENPNDLNKCLYSNLIEPAEGGGANEKLDISLKYLPENPINDISENKSGDTLSFTTSITNATNSSYLNYTWAVYANKDANPDDWGPAIEKSILDGATQMTGLGIDTFKFNLNFTEANFSSNTNTGNKIPKYLKITVTAKDIVDDGTREGHTNIVVPLFSSGNERIEVYTAKAYLATASDPIPSVGIASEGTPEERCLFTDPNNGTKTPQSICEVAKDELIAMKIDNAGDKYSDFLWTIDGKTQICPADKDSNLDYLFANCLNTDGTAKERTYFPILKNPGDQYSVTLSALDKTSGEKLNLTRVFQVYAPEAQIIPTEKVGGSTQPTCLGLLLGEYQDFDGISYPDRSTTKFQALTGNNIEVVPKFSGTVTPQVITSSEYTYQWNVDGTPITIDNYTSYGYDIDLDDYGKLILPPKDNGEKYTISFSTTFAPTALTKKLLNKFWDITYNDFYEKKLSAGIEIEMTSASIAQAENSPKKILATVSSGIPSYIAFLFRIMLSGCAIIFALKIIFSILPKTKIDEF